MEHCEMQAPGGSTSEMSASPPGLKRSILLSGKKTSISLEDEFWAALRRIAAAEGKSISAFVASAPLDRRTNLSSALRVFILRHTERLAGLG
jgi:predicted DNA-binding ribbon-helix-helix protein